MDKLERLSLVYLSSKVYFGNKAGAHQSGAPFRCSPLGCCADITWKYYPMLNRLARGKYSYLYGLTVDEEEI